LKLLFDANLSPALIRQLGSAYSGSDHVLNHDLPDDRAIWDFAAASGFVVVSKDTDFFNLSMVYGAPPKVVWLRIGNAGTAAVAGLLLRERSALEALVADPDAAMLILRL
jgi:predicted nuclease of predicted toxin-antitoxin system